MTAPTDDRIDVTDRRYAATSAWTYRCPRGHEITLNVAGHDEPAHHVQWFRNQHANCAPATPEAQQP
ncbi:hypothetical protein [Polymorphospora lycopeni]|uniref:Uncharacterized protein n=1 Tax=Polymorphospora lycopeni TaxID=3140240 RepID=A0ABV5CKY4_9ACTN